MVNLIVGHLSYFQFFNYKAFVKISISAFVSSLGRSFGVGF